MLEASKYRQAMRQIFVAMDHKGIFRTQDAFFDPDIPRQNRKHLTVAHLHPEIRELYEPAAKNFAVPLDEIRIMTEDTLRAAMFSLRREGKIPNDERVFGSGCSSAACSTERERVSCQGVTAAIISKLASSDPDEIHTFWNFDHVRTDPQIISKGTAIAQEFFTIRARIIQHFVHHMRRMPEHLSAYAITWKEFPPPNNLPKRCKSS